MNNGAFGENFPYTNFHDLNTDWIIKIAKDFLDQYTNIQETIAQGLTDLDDKTQAGLTGLQDKFTELEGLLNAWYSTHSNDIASALASALSGIAAALNSSIAAIDLETETQKNAFTAYADQKTASSIASIPSDYTALSNSLMSLYPTLYAFANAYGYSSL